MSTGRWLPSTGMADPNPYCREILQLEAQVATLREAVTTGKSFLAQRFRQISADYLAVKRERDELAAQVATLRNILAHLAVRPDLLGDEMYRQQVRAALAATEPKETPK